MSYSKIAELPTLTLDFIIFIVFLTLLFHLRYNEKTVTFAPTILTTTGIFATFVGIAVGLSDFDVANIQASVPALLAGLKTAFWASVCGVGAALTIKFRYYFFGAKPHSGAESQDQHSIESLVQTLQGIHYSLAGNDDSTVVSQLKLLRQDTNDRLDALKKLKSSHLKNFRSSGRKLLSKH